jgi:hypothetical protein
VRPDVLTHEQSPPLAPPDGVLLHTAWVLGAQFAAAHAPLELDRRECGRCGAPVPCLSRQFAERFLASLLGDVSVRRPS